LAIGRSILLPGEDLMHKMDREYNEYGEIDPRDEAEVRRDKDLSGKKNLPGGKGVEQDPERNRKDNNSEERDGPSGNRSPNKDHKGKNKAEIQLS
jgi:hypothetical protein